MTPADMATPSVTDKRSSYDYGDLIASGLGKLPGMPRLPAPPMLVFDRITEITIDGGETNKGKVRAELDIRRDLFFWACHFVGKPVMPGCLQNDGLWQLLGFFLGWLGTPGEGFALGVGELKFSAKVLPTAKLVQYGVDVTRIVRIAKKKSVIAMGNGWVKRDGEIVCTAQDLKVGFSAQLESVG